MATEKNKEQSVPSKEVLRLQVRPLTSDELEKEATAWQSRVQKKVAEVSSLQLENLHSSGSNTQVALQQEEQSKLLSRFRLVLDEWERKGGDTKKFREYASAVSGLEFDFYNLQATFLVLKNWLL